MSTSQQKTYSSSGNTADQNVAKYMRVEYYWHTIIEPNDDHVITFIAMRHEAVLTTGDCECTLHACHVCVWCDLCCSANVELLLCTVLNHVCCNN